MSDPIGAREVELALHTLAARVMHAAATLDTNRETSIAPTGDCDGPESDEPRAAPTWQGDRGEEDGA